MGATEASGASEDTLVDDPVPKLASCVLGLVEGVLPQALLWDVINRALDQSLVALLRAAGETELADRGAVHWRGWSRAEIVPRLLAIEAQVTAREVVHPPLLQALNELVTTLRRYDAHDASPREILTMALSVARLAGTLAEEHEVMRAICQRPREEDEELSRVRAALEVDEPDAAAIARLVSLAEEGVPRALGTLGVLYGLGFGVPLDAPLGARLLAEATALGEVASAHNLSTLYGMGAPGLPANPEKARLFLQLCRERGFPM